MSDSLQPNGLQHARLPCPSPTPGACSNSCPQNQWCHPTISSSIIPFSPLPSTFPSIRIFSNESVLRIRWPKYWSAVGSVIIWEHPAQPRALLEGSREELVLICCPKGYVRVAGRVRDQGRTGHSQQRRNDGFYQEITRHVMLMVIRERCREWQEMGLMRWAQARMTIQGAWDLSGGQWGAIKSEQENNMV